jgi:AmmeMemoRadiSam system protein B/AmmeMemoRadiSam system protein A
MSAHPPSVRPPAVAGQFYPGRPQELRAQVEDLLSRAPDVDLAGRVVGVVVPHAGYPYSGQTAANAFRQVRGARYDAVVVLAPSHREPFGEASVYPGEGYETPLGVAQVHRELARAIASGSDRIALSEVGHRISDDPFSPLKGEHAVEVQLPFLQVVLPGVPIVPIVMGGHSLEACRDVAEGLEAACADSRVLIVASSDLYHGPDRDACVASDERTLEQIVARSPEGFWQGLREGRLQACGSGPVLTLLLAARRAGATAARLISRTTSADVTHGPSDYVVGYGAVLILAPDPGEEADKGLDPGARKELGAIARQAVQAAARGKQPAPPPSGHAALGRPGRAFVTLYAEGRLRGCIGDLQGTDALGRVVQRMAGAAAVRDPRFPPLGPDELAHLQIEISVIGSFRPVRGPEDIRIGQDGLWIKLGFHQGVLLPKVAAEYGWDPAEFLSHTCSKAQLPADAWKDPDAELQAFTADVFAA